MTVGERTLTGEVRSGSTFMSQSDFRLQFGLGAASTAEAVEVQWPGGALEKIGALPAGQIVTITEGKGVTGSDAIHQMTALLLALALGQTAPDCGKFFAAGLQEYQRKDLSKALIAFRAAVQCDPKLVQAHLAIADIYAERGNEGEALAALLQALQIEPKNVLALRAASNLYLKNGLHNKALPLLETLVRWLRSPPMPMRTWRRSMRQAAIAKARKRSFDGRWSCRRITSPPWPAWAICWRGRAMTRPRCRCCVRLRNCSRKLMRGTSCWAPR